LLERRVDAKSRADETPSAEAAKEMGNTLADVREWFEEMGVTRSFYEALANTPPEHLSCFSSPRSAPAMAIRMLA
jgi:hypothetical protein